MRNILIVGFVTFVAGCGGVPPDGNDPLGATTGTLTAPAAATTPATVGVGLVPAGHLVVPIANPAPHRTALLRRDGVPHPGLTETAAHSARTVEAIPEGGGGSSNPTSSDPMPARGDDEDKGTSKGGDSSGGGSGGDKSGSSGGGSGTGLGGTAPAQGTDTGNAPGGEGKSDPMPADDTRRN